MKHPMKRSLPTQPARRTLTYSTLTLSAFIYSSLAPAHTTGSHAISEGLTLSAGLATTVRSGPDPLDTPWQIPGKLMGGEANLPESGFTLDDAHLEATFRHRSGVVAGAELSSHHDSSVTFEQAWAGFQAPEGGMLRSASLMAGQMNAAFSPEINLHASRSAFSTPRLIDSSFYGGHFNDTGVKGQMVLSDWQLGAELWQGDTFPATPGQGGGSQDVFAYWRPSTSSAQWVIGGWLLHSRADQRIDERLTSGHSHGTVSVTTADTVRYDGGEQHLGVHAGVTFDISATVSAQFVAEWIEAHAKGTLKDTTHLAELEGDYRGYWIQPSLIWSGNQSLVFRYERLILKNRLSGAGATALVDPAGLGNPGEDPESMGISYRFYPILSQSDSAFWHQLGIRLEWTRVDAGIEDDYVGIGLLFRAQDSFAVN